MATKQRRRRPLTKERVLEKAVAVADKDGIDALSMRKLGHALGVEAMSLYKHVGNKGELVSAMVDSVIGQFELPDDEPAWDVAIRRCAVRRTTSCSSIPGPAGSPSSRATCAPSPVRASATWSGSCGDSAKPASPRISCTPPTTRSTATSSDSRCGSSATRRNPAFATRDDEPMEEFVARMLEQMRPNYPYLAEHGEQHMAEGAPNGKQEFEFGLDLILDGLKRRRRASAR